LLGVFLLGAQLAPAAHLATHRNDHTHGPVPDGPRRDEDHAAAHRTGRPHGHPAAVETPTRAARGARRAADRAAEPAHPNAGHDHHAGAEAEAPEPAPSPEHGRDSVSHFDVAILAGPPAPVLPPPAEALAPRPDTFHPGLRLPLRRQQPARAPPALLRRTFDVT
jgi:hypothetical protein